MFTCNHTRALYVACVIFMVSLLAFLLPRCAPAAPNCAMAPTSVAMRWGDGTQVLQLPMAGHVVMEAHLATTADDFLGWPSTQGEGIIDHYRASQAATGHEMERTQPWAPPDGGTIARGSTGMRLPVVDESWYICMNWARRPARGTRMLVRNPVNGRTVVASAGWETGPGSPRYIAGVTEETHNALGSTHGGKLVIGFAVDQRLPLGPIDCAPGP